MTTDHTALKAALQPHVADRSVPGLVAAVATADDEQVVVLGHRALDGPAMTRDSIFRIASITKPILAAATMVLVERGVLGLDDPVAPLLPELAQPRVLRSATGPVDDTVPAVRPITTRHLLTFTAGHGFPSDFSAPVVPLLFEQLAQGPPNPQVPPAPDIWMERLSGVPLLHQPGEGWTYNTGSDILGVLVARASGQPLPQFLGEHLFEPLGMTDTGFHVPPATVDRLTSYYRAGAAELELIDGPAGQWTAPPAFPSGAGGLVSTVDDWLAFGRMLAGQGEYRGRRVLSAPSVRAMATNALDELSRDLGRAFLDGQGWGFGGGVDVIVTEPWTEPGRYGWIGGTGTAAHVSFTRGVVTVLLTQVELAGPVAPPVMQAFWTTAAR